MSKFCDFLMSWDSLTTIQWLILFDMQKKFFLKIFYTFSLRAFCSLNFPQICLVKTSALNLVLWDLREASNVARYEQRLPRYFRVLCSIAIICDCALFLYCSCSLHDVFFCMIYFIARMYFCYHVCNFILGSTLSQKIT